MTESDERTTGLVVAGAGARGAYEAGVLAALLPELEARGERPRVLVGTSAGAINVALLAAFADEPAAVAAEQLVAFWSGLTTRDVWRPVLRSGPATVVRYAAEVVGLPRPSLTSLFDTAPMRSLAAGMAELVARANHNVESGLLDAVAVVTTDIYRGRTGVFCKLAPGLAAPGTDGGRAIDYLPGELSTDHVLASSAIPLAFPAVELDHPTTGPRWYGDGGVRLNTPLKPALDLGADRLVVVATHPATATEADRVDVPSTMPELDDHLVHLLDAVLVDRMVEDLRTMRRVNTLVDAAGENLAGYHHIDNLFVGPSRRETLGELAATVFAEDVGLVERWLPTGSAGELGLLRRLLASGDGPRSGDVLSFLFFHPDFAAAAIALGRRDAAAALAAI